MGMGYLCIIGGTLPWQPGRHIVVLTGNEHDEAATKLISGTSQNIDQIINITWLYYYRCGWVGKKNAFTRR